MRSFSLLVGVQLLSELARRRDVHSVAEQIEAEGQRALPLEFDIVASDAVQAAIDRVVSELGRVDILINNGPLSSLNRRSES